MRGGVEGPGSASILRTYEVPIEHDGTAAHASQRSKLRIFRQVAAEVLAALSVARDDDETVRVVRGYIESEGDTTRVREMCIPVRRAYLKNDPVNMGRIVDLLRRTAPPEIQERLGAFEVNYAPIQGELDSASILNYRRVTHAEMFEK